MPLRLALAAALLALPAAAAAQADGPRPLVVRVQVTDTAARPLGGVEVAVVHGLGAVVARRAADDAGRATLAFAGEPGDYEIVARRVGFVRSSQFLRVAAGDTVRALVRLVPVAQQLEAVRVTAREELKRKSYFIDADAIEASAEPIRHALDVVSILRPDMLTSRAGIRVCGPVREVWINGVRISKVFAPDPTLVGRPVRGVAPNVRIEPEILTILSQVHPEHIAEMRYQDCFDRSMAMNGTNNAIFIALKAGVEFVWREGTRVTSADELAEKYRRARR